MDKHFLQRVTVLLAILLVKQVLVLFNVVLSRTMAVCDLVIVTIRVCFELICNFDCMFIMSIASWFKTGEVRTAHCCTWFNTKHEGNAE